ncbi:hypothetical protein [Neobacillus sp. SuZ13]|uniref:hypothetical protein n=1 Tax=Neobacillus sp. SuZ13 TaxID=3047875 RepID=UPI0024BFB332|nr:hypothetical protein [Neobacillus sp. SuZ13]WHY69494.1 hypothetical protein QNH17_13015 [Neobacillus sp. SuZ13]
MDHTNESNSSIMKYWGSMMKSNQEFQKELHQEIQSLIQKIGNENSPITNLLAEKTAHVNRFQELEYERNLLFYKELQNKNAQLNGLYEQLRKEKVQLAEKYEELKEEKSQLADSNDDVKEKNAQLASSYEELKEEKAQLADSYDDVKEKNAQLATSYEELKEEKAQLADSYEELKEEKAQLADSYEELKEEKAQLADSYEELKEEKAQLADSYEELKEEKAQLADSYEELKEEKAQLADSYEELKEEKAQLADSYEELKEEKAQLADSYEELKEEKAQLDHSYKELQEAKDELTISSVELLQANVQMYKQMKALKSTINHFEEVFMTPLSPLLNGLLETESIREDLPKVGIEPLDGNSPRNYLALSKLTGQMYLARWVQESLFESKKKHLVYLSDSELSLIAEINQYYRAEGCQWDILVVPEPGRFEGSLVQDFYTPLRNYNKFSGVYTPAFFQKDNDPPTFKARVKGQLY